MTDGTIGGRFRGKSLSDYMRMYWTWALGGNQPGHHGNVEFLPIPPGEDYDAELDVYVGHADVSLKANESFFLPVFVFYGEQYNNELPDDDPDFPPDGAFTDADVYVTVDGSPVIDSSTDDLADFFVDTTYFKKPIQYDEPTGYGSVSAIWVKGIGFLHTPLAEGEHEMELLVTSDFLSGTFGFSGWHNTWNITVE